MKKHLLFVTALTGSLLLSPFVSAQQPAAPETMLQQMEKASTSLNYELAYINVSRQGIESLRYRHAIVDGQTYAQLLQMDGPRREVIQRGNDISYFDAGLQPFTLPGEHILDGLPSVLYADFNRLHNFYDFIPVGRSRVADQMCDVLRVVSRDGSRFSYVIWLDVDTSLPLRVDLLDQDGEPIEQFQVISFAVDQGVVHMMQGLKNANLPPALSLPGGEKTAFRWKTGWIPSGMQMISQNRRQLPNVNKSFETRLYSDGLFSFTINVTDADKNSINQTYRTGRRTVQIEVRNNKEISVVGELPAATAKRIADNVDAGN
ncbi:sigma-E factor regulatory protein RseB [Tatumella sp. JGM118]|uniref:sigma-E factor regulatory protein RseB n=1 Tax=Tatumella sp. JGM118 TaxID=2799796 RepID=UPI001BAE5BA7|nr:sigma-E factor regulatory protein RseB [Tatumella sp. JGM118]MBS0909000.1 sigma-E factor regulatory protein RseB [Tatumella sp. JGM118]